MYVVAIAITPGDLFRRSKAIVPDDWGCGSESCTAGGMIYVMPQPPRREGGPTPSQGERAATPVEKRGGYTPQGQAPRPTSPPPKPSDAGPSAKPPARS